MVKVLKKMMISLNYFEKLSSLLPAQVRYLQEYSRRLRLDKIPNSVLLERVGTILAKPHIKCPFDEYYKNIDFSKICPKRKRAKPYLQTGKKVSFISRLFGVVMALLAKINQAIKWIDRSNNPDIERNK